MTDQVTADHIYLLPLTVDSIEKILNERKIDAVLPTMGGQTALNLCKEADEKRYLEQIWCSHYWCHRGGMNYENR